MGIVPYAIPILFLLKYATMNKSMYGVLAVSVFAVFITGGYIASQTTAKTTATQGELAITEDYYDFGTVGLEPAEHTFTVQNVGAGPLTIARVTTSCGCTTARLETAAGMSRSFGMDHGNAPRADVTLPPGEKAKVIITYDPLAHGRAKAAGRFRRAIYIQTENPRGERQLTFDIVIDPDLTAKN